jgi:serine/threonine protein kinase
MIPSSPLFCNTCGAANQTQATLCWACGQPVDVSVEDTTPPSSSFASPAPQPAPAASAEALAFHALLAGRYRIIGIVGKGGFGAVYKAQDVRRNAALVAIKSINLHGLSSEEVIEATDTFNREMLLLSELQHSNLPRIYDHFTDREHWYLAMDFIEGETLDEYLSKVKGGHLAVEEVLYIGVQLCTVLDYLHSQQPPIIFRDVKPANVMRMATGHLYLIDFGIARRFTPGQKRDTTVLGSPGYAPPEQYGRAQTTVQSDIYSLGATLRHLLTGKDASEAVFSSASPYVQRVPAELQQLLAQMLELDAGKRPASMDVVKRTLQRIQKWQMSLHTSSLPPRVLPAGLPSQHPGYAGQQTPLMGGPGGQVLQSPAKRGISRRTVIIGLVSLVGLVTIGGGLTLSALSQGSQSSPQSFPQSPQVSPEPHLLYTYSGLNVEDAVAWSPDGKRIASGSWDTTVQVWDAADGGHVYTYHGHSADVFAVAWSPDGRRIASAGDKTVQVWDAANGGHVYTYRGHSDGVFAVAWSPDGRRIASGSWDTTVQVWDAANGGHVYTYSGHSGSVSAVAWSPDGRRIASGSADQTMQVWDAANGGHVYTYRGHSNGVLAVAWSPDGKRIASGARDHTVQVWDAADGGHVYTYSGHSGSVYAVAWSPDSKRIASGSADQTMQVWDAADGGNVYTYSGHSGSVYAVAWSPDGKRIASASDDTTVQVWNAP